MICRSISAVLILAVLFFGIPVMPASAVPAAGGGPALPAEVGRLTYVEGRVDRGAQDPLIKDQRIAAGDPIRTKSYSRAEIEFADGSLLRIGENSKVQIKEYALDGQGKRKNAKLFVERGKVRVIVSKSTTGETPFDIDTPNTAGRVKGSDICVSYLKSSTSILALDGEITAKSAAFPDKEIKVSRGTTAYVPYESLPFGPRPYLAVEKKRFETDTNPAQSTPDQIATRKAVIAKFTGAVRARTKGADSWHMPAAKEALGSGDEIETGENGKAQLVLESGRVVDLLHRSHLKITKLGRDPKTGSLEDILESKLGEIRAKIDKKKAGSTFEIHSPVAVAAVRGTILYLFITAESTRSFFEQGNGTLANLVKKANLDIHAGQNGSVDLNGHAAGPADTTPRQLDEIEKKDWDIEDGTYGYTPPSGQDDLPPYNNQQRKPGAPSEEDQNLFDGIKPGILGGQGPAGAAPLKPFGTWGPENNDTSLYSNAEGSFQWRGEDRSKIMTAVFPWTSTQPFITLGGTFSDTGKGERPLLFNTLITSRIENEAGQTPNGEAASDGGAFFGFTAGLWSGVEGTIAALFVDPQKNVGLFTGSTNGSINNAAGTFTASGNFEPAGLGTFPNIQPEFFSEYISWGYAYSDSGLSGDFNGEGYLEAGLDRAEIRFLVDEERSPFPSFDFGIYNFRYEGGEFWRPEGAKAWNAVTGGWGKFGYWKSDSGYWLAELGGTFSDGEIRGSLTGAFLTQTHLGVLGGGVSGLYNQDEEGWGDFILQSIGAYQSSPLSFFNYFNADLDGFEGSEGSLEAYMGGADSVLINGGRADVFALGYFYNEGSGGRHIWRTDVNSTNAIERNPTTYNGGAYYAWMAGSHQESDLAGSFAGIYVGPKDEEGTAPAGLMTGNLSGQAFEQVQMFSMQGVLNSQQLDGVGIDAKDLVDGHIGFTGGEGRLAGSYEGEEGPAGEISGYDIFETASLMNESNGYAATWGIYRQEFGDASYDNPEGSNSWSGFMGGNDPFGFYVQSGEGYSFNDDYGYWIADITDGVWGNEGLSARLAGKFLTLTKTGTLEGNIFGLYNDGEWTAYGVGSWIGTPLDFAAVMDSSKDEGDFAFFNGEGVDTFGSLGNSLMGGAGNLFENSHVLFMGKYDTDENNGPLLWGITFKSYDVYRDEFTTFAGDGFYGLAGGRWSRGRVAGGAGMIYIRNDGGSENGYSAGIVSGSVNGSFFEFDPESGKGMWSAEGDFTSARLGETWISPQDLNSGDYGVLQERLFQGSGFAAGTEPQNLYPNIDLGAGLFVNLEGEDWGIWGGFFGGSYHFNSEEAMGSDFRTGFGAVAYDEYEEGYPIYLFGTLAGKFDALDETSGNVDATFNGVWISEQGTQQDSFVTVGTVSGQAAGDFSGNGSSGSWEAAGVGEWVNVTQLDPNQINLDQIQSILSDFAIGELLTAAVPGTGNFNGGAGAINGNMDISFFGNPESSAGIWSALFNGSFTGMPSEVHSWAATFTSPAGAAIPVTAQLTNGSWENGQWLANVTGSAGPAVGFSGQAGGTYTTNAADPASGKFSGVGVGTFQSAGQET